MTRFIKLTGYDPANVICVEFTYVQHFLRDDNDRCTGVYLNGGTRLLVRETPDEILALLQAPVDPSEPS